MSRVVVLPAGDSLTMGSPQWLGSYRRHLLNLAPNLNFVGTESFHLTANNDGYGRHQGYSGGTIATRGAATLSAIDTYAPSVVLIWYGVNEVQTDTEDLAELYTFASDCLAKTSVDIVIVGNIAPRVSTDPKFAQQNTYRSNIETHFTVTQAPLPAGMYFCDPGAGLGDSDLFDSVHLNDGGYKKAASAWYNALQQAGVQLKEPLFGADADVF